MHWFSLLPRQAKKKVLMGVDEPGSRSAQGTICTPTSALALSLVCKGELASPPPDSAGQLLVVGVELRDRIGEALLTTAFWRLSGISGTGVPPKNSKARTWLCSQSGGSDWDQVARQRCSWTHRARRQRLCLTDLTRSQRHDGHRGPAVVDKARAFPAFVDLAHGALLQLDNWTCNGHRTGSSCNS